MKTAPTHRTSVVLAILVLACSVSFAAKTQVRNPKNQATRGTTQLKGADDHALFTHTYTLGKTVPLNVTVDRAEYTVSQVSIGNEALLTNAGEKYLVLHYTLHNPNPSDYQLAWSTLEIFGVDANDQNLRYVTGVGIEGTGERCNMTLKPGQKTHAYTLIKMPAKGALPKLVLQSRDRLVLRYNLLEKDAKGNSVNPVKALPAPIADPSDPTGATALETVPSLVGEYYPLRDFDAKVESTTFSEAPIQGRAPKKGQRYFVAIVSARNACLGNKSFAWSTIGPKLIDGDGGEIRWNDTALFAGRDENARGDVGPGKEIRVRYYFEVPAKLALKSFSIQQTTKGRAYAYDLSGLK
jgi:hypothetical protein